jgi:uncharacterized membrane protein YphA (DoxX/SURF4 family)
MEDIRLLVLRLVLGGVFMAHGAQKLFGSFGGPGIEGTAVFHEHRRRSWTWSGIPMPEEATWSSAPSTT